MQGFVVSLSILISDKIPVIEPSSAPVNIYNTIYKFVKVTNLHFQYIKF